MPESAAPTPVRPAIEDGSADRIRLLFEVTRAFAEDASEYERLLDTVARKLSDVFGDVCIVRLLSDDGETLGVASVHTSDDGALALLRPILSTSVLRVADDPTVRDVLESGTAFLAPKYDLAASRPSVSPEVDRVTTMLRMHSRLVVPLRVRGRSIGIVSLGRFRPSSAPFDERDRDLVQFLADQAALAIGNARAQAAVRAANAALESSIRRYRALLDNANDLIAVTSPGGIVLEVNRAWERTMGVPRGQAVGRHLGDFVPRDETVARSEEFKAHVSAGGGTIQAMPVRRADGTVFQVEGSRTVIEVGGETQVLSIARDVTERRRLENQLRQAQVDAVAKRLSERLASAVESIEDAFALFGDDDRLVICNAAYRSLLGGSMREPLVGKTFEELLVACLDGLSFATDDERTQFRAERVAGRHGGPPLTFEVLTRSGRHLRVADRSTPEGGIVETISDVTDDKRHSEELREARARAEAANEAKSEFLASMSHELRTPLNAILGFGQLLRRDRKEPLSQRHSERLDQILEGGEHLLRLVEDILDLSRIEAGGLSIETKALSVAGVLEQVKRTLEPMAVSRGIHLEVETPDPALPMLAADRSRLAQILMNLGSNAVKYNRPGGDVIFTARSSGPERVRLTVRDTGMGIPASKQDRLFQPFQRAGQESGPIEGTGIGLVITRRLAALMGGEVGFRSVFGEGSEFWVDMPVHAPAGRATEPGPAPRAGSPLTATSGERRVILYVEDNAANVAFMSDLAGTMGTVELLTAPTGEMGIDLARERQPDAIIMDINLPGMSGIEALRVLRAAPETSTIPVIGLTASALERDKAQGMQEGFDEYFTKPLDIDRFAMTLGELLASPRQRHRG